MFKTRRHILLKNSNFIQMTQMMKAVTLSRMIMKLVKEMLLQEKESDSWIRLQCEKIVKWKELHVIKEEETCAKCRRQTSW